MSLPSFIEKYIDNKENIKNIDIGNNKGLKDYIDFLDIDNFDNSNVVFGYDVYNRFFISVIYKNVNYPKYPLIMTIFQRYTYEKYFYVSCDNTFIKHNIVETFDFNKEMALLPFQFENFFKLINNGNINIIQNDKEYNYELFFYNIST